MVFGEVSTANLRNTVLEDIHEAQKSLEKRARQLWYEMSGEIKKREALSSAAHLLEVLRSCFAPCRTEHRQHRAA